MSRELKTKGWVERLVLQELCKKDRRYKHNYRSKSREAKDLYGFHRFYAGKEDVDGSTKTTVRRALNGLKEKGLVRTWSTKHRDRTAIWEITEDGLEEVSKLNEEYWERERGLRKKFGLRFK